MAASDNSNPFELKVTKVINNVTEDISTLTQTYAVNYDWNIRGRLWDPTLNSGRGGWTNSINLGLYNRQDIELKRNQKSYKPLDDFNGECVTNALECIVLNNSASEVAKIHIPIHLLLNKYGNAAINGWDGNSVSIDKNGNGVILAPQIGAGQKETDNSFTGMLMGSVKEAGKNKIDIGLFGYNFGERSMFLNAKDGSAIFGKKGPGQIILDPKSEKAMLYSNGYWTNYNDDGKPSSYSAGNKANAGMLIDLTTPLIEWGNGNFKVDADGHITAKGGGTIAGFNIDDDSLYTGTKNSSSNVRLSSNDGKFTRTINGTNRDNLHLAINNKFAVDTNGNLYSAGGQIGGWTIDTNQLQSNNGNTHIYATGRLVGPNWEIDAAGNATFNNVKITSSGYSSNRGDLINYGTRFRVESNGTLHAANGQFSGSISGSAITGSTIDISANGGFLRMGAGSNWTKHPLVSGLNVQGSGITMSGSGISGCSGLTGEGNVNISADGRLDLSGNTLYLRAKSGLGNLVFLKSDATRGFSGLDVFNHLNAGDWGGTLKVQRVNNTGMADGYYEIKFEDGNIKSVDTHAF